MEKEFGTEHLIRRRFFYSGLDGTDKFLMEMASKLGMDGEVEEVVLREKNHAIAVIPVPSTRLTPNCL